MVLVIQSEKRGVKIDPTLVLQGFRGKSGNIYRICCDQHWAVRENTRTQVQCVTIFSCRPIEMQIRLLGARETISVSQKHAIFLQRMYCKVYCTVYRSNVLALYSFYPPERKCIIQSKTQRSQINFTKEPNLATEPRCGQPWSTLYIARRDQNRLLCNGMT